MNHIGVYVYNQNQTHNEEETSSWPGELAVKASPQSPWPIIMVAAKLFHQANNMTKS